MTRDQIHDMLIACRSDNPVVRANALNRFADFLFGMQEHKDATRFRKLTEMAGVSWQQGDTEWCSMIPGDFLREEIDKEL